MSRVRVWPGLETQTGLCGRQGPGGQLTEAAGPYGEREEGCSSPSGVILNLPHNVCPAQADTELSLSDTQTPEQILHDVIGSRAHTLIMLSNGNR